MKTITTACPDKKENSKLNISHFISVLENLEKREREFYVKNLMEKTLSEFSDISKIDTHNSLNFSIIGF